MTKQEEYNQIAIDWVEDYLLTTQSLQDVISFDGITILNTHEFLRVSLSRLKLSNGREQFAAFYRIKKYKDWINTKS